MLIQAYSRLKLYCANAGITDNAYVKTPQLHRAGPLENRTVPQLVRKFPKFRGAGRLIIVFTGAIFPLLHSHSLFMWAL